MSIEAMKQALEYIKDIYDHCSVEGIEADKEEALVQSLRQAIEQAESAKPEQFEYNTFYIVEEDPTLEIYSVFTDEDEAQSVVDHKLNGKGRVIKVVRELAKPEQEPTAWMTNSEQDVTAEFLFSHVQTPMHNIPLYEAPPKRELVGQADIDKAIGEINEMAAKKILELEQVDMVVQAAVLAEREACAKIFEEMLQLGNLDNVVLRVVNEIRARDEK